MLIIKGFKIPDDEAGKKEKNIGYSALIAANGSFQLEKIQK